MEQPERKAQNHQEMLQEYAPFVLYAAIPIFITICVALTFGVS